MYRPIRTGAAVLCATLLLLGGCASNPMVQNIQGASVPAGSTMSEVYDAIVEGGKVRGWKIRQIEPGHAEGTLFVRSHVAKVDVFYDTDSYSIEYKDSENLEYEDGTIHGNYNKWVQNLDGDIQRALVY
ncbi:MAG: hypothetical protein U5Q16_03880 [Gammaproteobacteria bacterium]|nr:hypothetical protein [Gammaproteobacteria bacterium]